MYEDKLYNTHHALGSAENNSKTSLALDMLLQINLKQEQDYLFFSSYTVKYLPLFYYLTVTRATSKSFLNLHSAITFE